MNSEALTSFTQQFSIFVLSGSIVCMLLGFMSRLFCYTKYYRLVKQAVSLNLNHAQTGELLAKHNISLSERYDTMISLVYYIGIVLYGAFMSVSIFVGLNISDTAYNIIYVGLAAYILTLLINALMSIFTGLSYFSFDYEGLELSYENKLATYLSSLAILLSFAWLVAEIYYCIYDLDISLSNSLTFFSFLFVMAIGLIIEFFLKKYNTFKNSFLIPLLFFWFAGISFICMLTSDNRLAYAYNPINSTLYYGDKQIPFSNPNINKDILNAINDLDFKSLSRDEAIIKIGEIYKAAWQEVQK